MASTSKCPYCDGMVTSNEKICPHCGASNLNYVEDRPNVVMAPKTIEELKEFCAERGMPLLRMRFFIGEDFKEPCAFGIFKREDGTVVVYKNKDTGVRAIRYEGPDEAFGVMELYLKLLDECHKRNIFPETVDGKPPAEYLERRSEEGKQGFCWIGGIALFFLNAAISTLAGETIPLIITIIIALIPLSLTFLCLRRVWNKRKTAPIKQEDVKKDWRYTMTRSGYTFATILFCVYLLIGTVNTVNLIKHPVGYYKTSDDLYYRLNNNWYRYDSGDWRYDSSYDGSDSTYKGTGWSSSWGDRSDKFTNSDAYSDYWEAHHSSSSSDYDSWDSGDTDWGSDW